MTEPTQQETEQNKNSNMTFLMIILLVATVAVGGYLYSNNSTSSKPWAEMTKTEKLAFVDKQGLTLEQAESSIKKCELTLKMAAMLNKGKSSDLAKKEQTCKELFNKLNIPVS